MPTAVLHFRIEDDGTIAVLDQAGQKLGGVGTAAEETGRKGERAFSQLGARVIELNQAFDLARRTAETLARPIAAAVGAAAEQQSAIAALNAQLQAQGRYSASYSAALQAQATALANVTVYADEVVESAQAILAIFPRISNDVLPKATVAATNLATAFGGDLSEAARAVGLALNDPAEGLGRLSRAGIRFTQDQQQYLQTLVESGQVTKAQTLILAELESRLGGRAAAAAETFTGRMQQLKNAFGELQEEAGNVLVQSDAVQGGFALVKDEVMKLAAETRDYLTANREVIESGIREFFAELPRHIAEAKQDLADLKNVFSGLAELQEIPLVTQLVNSAPSLKSTADELRQIAGLLRDMQKFSWVNTSLGLVGLPPVPTSFGNVTAGGTSSTDWQAGAGIFGGPGAMGPVIPAAELARRQAGTGGFVAPRAATETESKARAAADKSAVAAEQAAQQRAESTLNAAKAELAIFQQRLEGESELAATAKERTAITLAGAAQELALAHQIDAAQANMLDAQIRVLQEKRKGADVTAGEKELLDAQVAELALQKQLLAQSGGESAKVAADFAKIRAEAERANRVVLDLGESLNSSIERAIDGILAGGGAANLENVFKKTGEALLSSIVGGFLKAQLAKDEFDLQIGENFTITLPGFFKQGADTISSIWSDLMDFLGFSSNQVTSDVVQNFGDVFRSIDFSTANTANNISGLTRNLGMGVGGGAGEALFTAGELGGASTIAGGTSAFGGAEGTGLGAFGAAGAGGLGGLSAGLGIAGIIIAGMQMIGQIVQGFDKGFKAASAKAYEYGASSGDVAAAALSKDIAGSLWSGIFGERIGGEINYIALTAGFGPVLGPLLGLFQPKTRGTINKKAVAKAWAEAGLPQQVVYEGGGRGGLRAVSIEAAPTLSIAEAQAALGFPGAGVQQNVGLQQQLIAAATAQPGVQAFATGAALGIGAIMGPNAQDAVAIANDLTNNLLLLGVSAKEGKRELRAFAESVGIDLETGLQDIQNKYLAGILSPEGLKAGVAGLAELFSDDLPAGVDASAIAIANFTDKAGVDIASFNEDMTEAVTIFAKLQETETRGLRAGLDAAAAAYAERNRLLATGGDVADILAANERGREALASSLADAAREGITTAILDGVNNAIQNTPAWTALQDVFAAAVTGAPIKDLPIVISSVVSASLPILNAAAETIAEINKSFATTPFALRGEAETIHGEIEQRRIGMLSPRSQQTYFQQRLAEIDAEIAAAGGNIDVIAPLLAERHQIASQLAEVPGALYSPGSGAYRQAESRALAELQKTEDLYTKYAVEQADALTNQTDATKELTTAQKDANVSIRLLIAHIDALRSTLRQPSGPTPSTTFNRQVDEYFVNGSGSNAAKVSIGNLGRQRG